MTEAGVGEPGGNAENGGSGDNGPWYLAPVAELNHEMEALARARQDSLTKPKGALGRLEEVAISLAGMQSRIDPRVKAPIVVVFAGDHGVVKEGVSLYPQSVTAEMLRNFSRGTAAITVLARSMRCPFQVVNVGTVEPVEELPNVVDKRIAAGAANVCREEAMTPEQFEKVMAVGKAVIDAAPEDTDCFIGGEMGIGNSTIAAALAVAHTGLAANAMVGPGTGVDKQGVAKKVATVTRIVGKHLPHIQRGAYALQRIGGFELSALAAAYIRAAQKGIPSLVDGYIATAAAVSAMQINPGVRDWLFFSHCSAEPGHRKLLAKLDAVPLLDLDLALGEGSGAALALPMLKAACNLHNHMATFEEAGVSQALS